jgi:hypothetical protein
MPDSQMQARETSTNVSLGYTETDEYPDQYPRGNWHGDDLDDEPSPSKGHGHVELAGVSRKRFVAKELLRDGARFLDRELLTKDMNEWYGDAVPVAYGEAVEVSEPRHFEIADESRESRAGYANPKRENETDGRLVSGPVIADRDLDSFLARIDDWLLYLRTQHGVSERDANALRKKAEWLKRHDERGWHDVRIVEELARAIEQQGSIQEALECL